MPEPALQLLIDLGISYQELGRGGFDYAQKTLRDLFSPLMYNVRTPINPEKHLQTCKELADQCVTYSLAGQTVKGDLDPSGRSDSKTESLKLTTTPKTLPSIVIFHRLEKRPSRSF